MRLTVTIITLNEESNLARALNSALFADEIVIVDSGSQDRTLEIAKSFGPKIKILHNPWPGWGAQKNFAAHNASGDWIFSLDADEEISPELKKSITAAIENGRELIYKCPRLTNYCGQWIRHGGWYPDFQERLWPRGKALWTTPEVHERLRSLDPKLEVKNLTGDLLHYSFPSFSHQLSTNRNFSLKAAQDYLRQYPQGPGILKIMFKPWWKFLEAYILKAGFLDGMIGLFIAINSAHAMFSKLAQAYLLSRRKEAS